MRHRYYFIGGLAAGYVLGAAAGRERYEQIKSAAQKVLGNPKVQQTATELQHNAAQLVGSAKDKVKDKVAGKIGEHDFTSWMTGHREHNGPAEGPGPIAAEGSNREDPWAAATKSHGPVH